jgi:hypothetical protein
MPGGSRLFRERYKQNENEAPEIAPKGEEKGYTTVVPLGREKDSAFIYSQPIPKKSRAVEKCTARQNGSGPGQQPCVPVGVARLSLSLPSYIKTADDYENTHRRRAGHCWVMISLSISARLMLLCGILGSAGRFACTERRIRKNFFSFHFLLERQQHQGDSDRWELIIFTMYVTRREESARMR